MWNDPTVQKYLDVLAIYSKFEVRSKVNAASPSNANHAWLNAPSCVTGWCKQAAPLDAPVRLQSATQRRSRLNLISVCKC
jgi:hypothetical protein